LTSSLASFKEIIKKENQDLLFSKNLKKASSESATLVVTP
jgi:hypothetical protein